MPRNTVESLSDLQTQWSLALAFPQGEVDIALVASLERKIYEQGGVLPGAGDGSFEGLTAARRTRKWNPLLHPRGRDGRFIHKFGWIKALFRMGDLFPESGNSNEKREFHAKVLEIIPDPKGLSPDLRVQVGRGKDRREVFVKADQAVSAKPPKAYIDSEAPELPDLNVDVEAESNARFRVNERTRSIRETLEGLGPIDDWDPRGENEDTLRGYIEMAETVDPKITSDGPEMQMRRIGRRAQGELDARERERGGDSAREDIDDAREERDLLASELAEARELAEDMADPDSGYSDRDEYEDQLSRIDELEAEIQELDDLWPEIDESRRREVSRAARDAAMEIIDDHRSDGEATFDGMSNEELRELNRLNSEIDWTVLSDSESERDIEAAIDYGDVNRDIDEDFSPVNTFPPTEAPEAANRGSELSDETDAPAAPTEEDLFDGYARSDIEESRDMRNDLLEENAELESLLDDLQENARADFAWRETLENSDYADRIEANVDEIAAIDEEFAEHFRVLEELEELEAREAGAGGDSGGRALDRWYAAQDAADVDSFGATEARDLTDAELSEAIEDLTERNAAGDFGRSGPTDLRTLYNERNSRLRGDSDTSDDSGNDLPDALPDVSDYSDDELREFMRAADYYWNRDGQSTSDEQSRAFIDAVNEEMAERGIVIDDEGDLGDSDADTPPDAPSSDIDWDDPREANLALYNAALEWADDNYGNTLGGAMDQITGQEFEERGDYAFALADALENYDPDVYAEAMAHAENTLDAPDNWRSYSVDDDGDFGGTPDGGDAPERHPTASTELDDFVNAYFTRGQGVDFEEFSDDELRELTREAEGADWDSASSPWRDFDRDTFVESIQTELDARGGGGGDGDGDGDALDTPGERNFADFEATQDSVYGLSDAELDAYEQYLDARYDEVEAILNDDEAPGDFDDLSNQLDELNRQTELIDGARATRGGGDSPFSGDDVGDSDSDGPSRFTSADLENATAENPGTRVEVFSAEEVGGIGSQPGTFEVWTVDEDGSRNGGRGSFGTEAEARAYADATNYLTGLVDGSDPSIRNLSNDELRAALDEATATYGDRAFRPDLDGLSGDEKLALGRYRGLYAENDRRIREGLIEDVEVDGAAGDGGAGDAGGPAV